MTRIAPLAAVCACAVLASSCTSSIPAAPENLSPVVDAEIVQGSDTRFTWKAMEDVDYYEFHLFNRPSGDIEQYYQRDLLPDIVCADEECSVELTVGLPPDEAHAWRVRAANAEGISGWSRSVFSVVPPPES